MVENVILDKISKCVNSIRKRTSFVPDVALILGSGLGDYASNIKIECEIPYSEIEGMPTSTVQGHDGRFIFGTVGDTKVVCMKGRVHFYEGYSISDVVMPTRIMAKLGAKILFLTNAAGGVNYNFKAGDLMLITDHISCFAPNPLIGPNIDEFGVRFPDMSHVYDVHLQDILRKVAVENKIPLKEGVYCQLTGPSYETPAEIRMLRTLGTDSVGMSTVVEAIAANHMGMKICGVSCICNLAAGMNAQPLSHKEVQEAADMAAPRFTKLVTEFLKAIDKEGLTCKSI
ncbi:purine-nucleoside phosphorylase [Butyrivibrio sp. NC3005]|uniref:purine-nucleoside phosphorylase n=1 Tax=Butyrivibrio sp. NC3005 TaxID=1280685 RepID=UPI000419D16E|nr:purine-nucleoside phosphorylase [Butyrivibrio sp. NC3005]